MIRLHFCATNYVVKYEALVNGMQIATELGVQRLYIHGDSELVVNQVSGSQITVTPTWWHTVRR
jgi:ribonuclease HI